MIYLASSLDEVDVEQQEFLQFLHDSSLFNCESQAIKQQIEANIQKLKKSKKYRTFRSKIYSGIAIILLPIGNVFERNCS